MDRAKRVGEFWSYLPTFRLVAELESASGAARVLGLTPSAVSKALCTLEASIGQPLFNRAGRELVLNDAGAHLLTAVRTSMRSVDEGLSALRGGRLVGPVRISSWEPMTSCVVPRLVGDLLTRFPSVVPVLTDVPRDRVTHALLDGSSDLVLTTSAPARRSADLAVRRIASCKTSLYAPRGHPILSKKQLGPGSFESEGFVSVGEDGGAWPTEIPRAVRAQAGDLDAAAKIAAVAGLLVVLPEMCVANAPELRLVRVPSGVPRPLTLYGVWRKSFEEQSRAEIALELAGKIVDELASP